MLTIESYREIEPFRIEENKIEFLSCYRIQYVLDRNKFYLSLPSNWNVLIHGTDELKSISCCYLGIQILCYQYQQWCRYYEIHHWLFWIPPSTIRSDNLINPKANLIYSVAKLNLITILNYYCYNKKKIVTLYFHLYFSLFHFIFREHMEIIWSSLKPMRYGKKKVLLTIYMELYEGI